MASPMQGTERRLASAPRLLIVDDDPVFTTAAAACLTSAGFEPKMAADGVEALELLERETFDGALIDLAMPRVDGFRLIGLVRNTPRLSRMAILVVSSRQDAEAFEEALCLGANAFQTKPINWRLLPVQIRYAIRSLSA